ncbi:taurine dioxygenase [Pseudomonas flavescens]|uniref:Taurine dioxygenase n=1 Tax=Phytopseudomonas flavescens TaxID=29435 RepID=A0A1G7Y210_9GAMM|nr:TauD/TfdA family dioxygenase [Pseudomonas flavescens]SDG90437.1 taurine dioxygenase [Pseudomonas flavescens]
MTQTAHVPLPAASPEDFRIEPQQAPLGAVVHGLDARLAPSAQQILQLKQALRDHHILIFRGQRLDDGQFLQFSSWFGSVFQPHVDFPVLSSGADGKAPEIVKVANAEDGELGNGELSAHSDHQWTPTPSSGSLLYALEVPQQGGETVWTNLALAYTTLDAATRAEIDGLRLINYNPFVRLRSGDYGRMGAITYRTPDIQPIQGTEHPLVRTHPESGKRLLFLGARTEVELVGVEAERGQELIARLREHLAGPALSYTHRWQVGDIVYWDNQATLHARKAFPAEQRRRLLRVSLAGSRPF